MIDLYRVTCEARACSMLPVDEAALRDGEPAEALAELWRRPPKPPVRASGAEPIAARLAAHGR